MEAERRTRRRALMRLFGVALGMAFVATVPLLIWLGPGVTDLSVETLIERLRATGWAWAAGIGLIVSDVVAPLPATAVMAALGVIYGPLIGGLLASLGGILAGSIAYWICRLFGRGLAERLAGPEGIAAARTMFQKWGFGLIVISRWLPILPETVAFAAGLTRVPFGRFLAALACGAVPIGFLFAGLGHLGREAPLLVIVACALLPLAGWGIAIRLSRRKPPGA